MKNITCSSGLIPYAARTVSRPVCRPYRSRSTPVGMTLTFSGFDPATFALLPRLEQAALWCVESSLRDAGCWGRHRDLRVGLVLGIGAEWMELWEEDAQRGGNRVLDPAQDFASTLERVHRALEFTGPALNLSAACASGREGRRRDDRDDHRR